MFEHGYKTQTMTTAQNTTYATEKVRPTKRSAERFKQSPRTSHSSGTSVKYISHKAKPLKYLFIIFMDSMNCIDGVLIKRFMVCAFFFFYYQMKSSLCGTLLSVWLYLSNLYKGVYDPDIGIGVEHLVEARLSIHQLQLIKLLVILEQRRHSQTERPCAEKSMN